MRKSSVIVLLGLLSCFLAVPIYNSNFTDTFQCEREKANILILVDSGDSYPGQSYYPPETTYLALKQLAVGLLRMEGVRLGYILFTDFTDTNFLEATEMEASFLSKYSEMIDDGYYNGGTTELEQPLRETITHFSDFGKDRTAPMKLIIIQADPNPTESIYAQRLRDSGVEIFGLGGNPVTYSSPLGSHYIPSFEPEKMQMQATDLLTLIRKQEGDTCYAWGFGQTHIVTFDGTFYDFAGVGDYYLFHSPSNGEDHLSVQVRQYSRSYNEELREGITQIRSVSVTMGEEIFIISLDPDTNIFRVQYREEIGDQFQDLDFLEDFYWIDDSNGVLSTGLEFYEDYVILQVSRIEPHGTYFVSLKHESNGNQVTIAISDHSTYISIKPVGTAYGESLGLCGKFDGCIKNDFTKRDGTYLSTEVVESKRKLKKYLPEFIEDWRLKYVESNFNLKGFEEYLPNPDWKPFTSTRSHKNSKVVCKNLPSALEDQCLYDVGAREHVYASLSTQLVMSQICDAYCANPQRKFHSFFEVEESCKLQCESVERNVNLHRRFNISIDDEEYRSQFYEIKETETSALFKPTINMGGKYVFTFRTNDYCYDNARNVTFQITCPKAPVIKAYSYFDLNEEEVEGTITVNSSSFGGSYVYLFGHIEEIKPEYRISWKVIDGNLSYWAEGKFMSHQDFLDEANQNILFSKTLTPVFMPKRIAFYVIEMVVNDGCRVTRTNVTVVSRCQKCHPIVHVDSFQKNSWNKEINQDGYWLSSSFSMNVLQTTVSNSFSRMWTLVSKDGDVVRPLSNQGQYEVVSIIKPRRTINTTNSQSVSKIVDEYVENDEGYPYTQDKAPYTIPELYSEERVTEWTETITSTFEEVFEEEIKLKCEVSINNPFSSFTSVEFDDAADLDDELALCKGFYTFEATVKDRCEPESGERTAKDTAILHLDCGMPPRTFLSCAHTVDFNYNTLSFPSVSLNGAETYDPVRGSNTNYLRYRWSINSAPTASTAKISNPNSNTNNFTPDTRGTYSIRLTASNQCNEESALVEVNAKCEEPPSIVANVDTSPLTYDGVQFQPAFTLTSSFTHQFPSAVITTWTLYSTPTVAPQLIGFVPSSSFQTPNSADTLFSPAMGGQYLVGVAMFDRCQPAVAKNITLQFNCPGTISNTVNPISNVDFDYQNQNFPAFIVDGSTSTVNGVSYTISPIHRWSYVSAPIGFFIPGTGSSPTYNVQPTVEGKYTIRHQYSDGCQYSFVDVSFNAICTNTPTAVPVATTASPFEIFNTITLDDNSQTQSVQTYSWQIVVQPTGSFSSIVNPSSKTPSFTPGIPGKYVITLTLSDGCRSASANLTLDVICPTINYRPTPAVGSSVSIYSKGKFARVELSEVGNNLVDEPDTFDYFWTIIAAPKGSVFEPTDISNVTSDITTVTTNTTSKILGTTNLYRNTVVRTRIIESFRRIRYVEIQNAPNPDKIFSSCFYPDIAGVYRARLTIAQDSPDVCYAKQADISVEARCNSAPVIPLGDQTVQLTQNKPTRVNLDATLTSDPEGDPLKFTWKLLPSSSEVPESMDIKMLTQTESPIASVLIRTQGTYTLQLTVTDGCSTTVKNIVINAQCAVDDYTLTEKQIKRQEEMRMLVNAYSGIQISRSEFEYVEKSTTENCTGIYEWKLVSFSDEEKDIITVEPFTSTGGFIATVVVVPIVGTALIVGGVVFILMKMGVIGGK